MANPRLPGLEIRLAAWALASLNLAPELEIGGQGLLHGEPHVELLDFLTSVGSESPTFGRVGLKIDGRMPAREGAEVFAGEEKVGRVTSGGFSPTLGLPIAMAYVDVAHAAEGTQLECEVRGKRLAATVTPMPFVPHRYYRGS